jgi:uncharacterized protein (TIGR03435 family)
VRAIALAALICFWSGHAAGPAAQQAEPPRFDVVSLKPTQPSPQSQRSRISLPTGRVALRYMTARGLIYEAYRPDDGSFLFAVEGAPGWAERDPYSLDVTMPPGTPIDRYRAMLRQALTDRFRLKARISQVERPILALVRARPDGPLHPGLTRSSRDCDAYQARVRAGTASEPELTDIGALPCTIVPTVFAIAGARGGTGFSSGGVTMEQFARSLNLIDGRQVFDRTGLEGRYEFILRSAPRRAQTPIGVPESTDRPPLPTALQEQLGLRLVSDKALVDVVVVDFIERPTEN